MEILLIFAALVISPFLLALPFYAYNRYWEMKDEDAQRIIDRLRGKKADWFSTVLVDLKHALMLH